MAEWPDLQRELDAWRALGRSVEFWWRDDDAHTESPALERLLELRRELAVPLALAVVPAVADEALARRLAGESEVVVFQHGWAHANHAPPGEKKQELGAHRPVARVTDELKRGWRRLQALFGRQVRPVLVPPWNRIDAAVVAALPGLGYTGISVLGPRRGPAPAGLARVNAHVDIVAWKTHRGFVGTGQALEQVLHHLAGRREGRFDPQEPTGLLTHHLDHDAACWEFAAEFVHHTRRHPAVRWGRTTVIP